MPPSAVINQLADRRRLLETAAGLNPGSPVARELRNEVADLEALQREAESIAALNRRVIVAH